MSSVLGCWASSGFTAAGCIALEKQLRACMDAPVGLFIFFVSFPSFSFILWDYKGNEGLFRAEVEICPSKGPGTLKSHVEGKGGD